MASRDFLKHTVSPNEPRNSSLGDEWYDPTTNKLYKRLAVNGTTVRYQSIGGSNAPISDFAPKSPGHGDLWWDSTIGQLRVYYVDADSSQWVDAVNTQGIAGTNGKTILNGTVDPTTQGVDGDFYINTTTKFIFGPKAAGSWPAGVALVGLGVPTGGLGGEFLYKSGPLDNEYTWETPLLKSHFTGPAGDFDLPFSQSIPLSGSMLGTVSSYNKFYKKNANNGPTILRNIFTTGATTSIDLSTELDFTIGSAGDFLFFFAMGDDAIPAAPSGDVNGAAVTLGTNTTNTVNCRWGYIDLGLGDTIISGISTAAAYQFIYVRDARVASPVVISAVATGTTGTPAPPTVNVPTPGCLILGVGFVDDDVGITGQFTQDQYTLNTDIGSQSMATYGTQESGGTVISAYKASYEVGAETPATFSGFSFNDAWVAVTIAIQPEIQSMARPIPSGGTIGQVLTKVSATNYDVTWSTASGGVTSVGGTGTVSGITLTGTVTSTGNLTLGGTLAVLPSNFASQTANTFLAAPNGAAGVPTFRALVAADVPTLNQNTTGTAATITGVYSGTITSSQVTTGLGFTPYNATNPNSYIALSSAITGYTAGTNTALAATDTLLAALGKIQGQITATPGTVTSVGGTGTVSGLTLTGTVTTTGNLTLGGTLAVTASNFSSQTANTFLAAPNGATGVPAFRTIVAADLPNTTVTAGAYTSANITIDAQGRITAAANGSGGGGATITNDTTTNSNAYYPAMATATSGTWSTAYVSSTKLYFNPSTGQLNATTFNSFSDATKKKNVVKIENATDIIHQIDGVEFDWIDNDQKSSGVIAQKLEEILPHLVSTSEDGMKSVNYSGLIAYLIESNKELSRRIESLENR